MGEEIIGKNKHGIRILKSYNTRPRFVPFVKDAKHKLYADPNITSLERYEALKVILTSNDRARFNSERLTEMGGLCLEMKRFQEARLYLTRAILIDGTNFPAKRGMETLGTSEMRDVKGMKTIRNDTIAESREMLETQYHWFKSLFNEKHIKYNEENASIEFARVCLTLDKTDEAEQRLKEIEKQGHISRPETFVLLGRIRFLRGDKFNAKTYYEHALFLDPNNKEAQEAMKVLG